MTIGFGISKIQILSEKVIFSLWYYEHFQSILIIQIYSKGPLNANWISFSSILNQIQRITKKHKDMEIWQQRELVFFWQAEVLS